MIDVRRQARGSRFRAGWRLSALVAWVTTVAVLFAQGIAPSYAEISVSTIGSADSVRMDILAWRAGMPSRVATYLPDRMDPVVTDVDPAMLRGARLVEKGTSGGWTYGALLTAGGALPATMDVSYRQTPSGLDTVTTNPADPTRTIAIHMPPPGPEEPQVIDPITWTVLALLAYAVCTAAEAVRDASCASSAKKACGDSGVKCVTSGAFCGLGACRYHCKGDEGSCD